MAVPSSMSSQGAGYGGVRFPKEVISVLHPNQYQVNETWIVFQLNGAPVITDSDEDFNVFALMDAASCFILGNEFVPASSEELSQTEAERLLESGYSHKKQYPKQLIIPNHLLANVLSREAERYGIGVIRGPEKELGLFISEAREGFQEHVSKGQVQ